jgi:tetratricopeptide (TPR) repeat protein
MRTLIALAIYVSLAAPSFAEGPVVDFRTLYDAGLKASEQHDSEQALDFFQRSWEGAITSEERGSVAANLGHTFRVLGRFKEAREWLERAGALFGTDPRLTGRLVLIDVSLADLIRTTGDYAAAERLLRETLSSPPCSTGCDVESKALLRNNLGDLLREEGHEDEARSLFKVSVDTAGERSRQRAGALIGLADIDKQAGDWKASIQRWNDALEICRENNDELTEAIALRGLGSTWLKAGNTARAEPMLRRVLRLVENNPAMPPEQIASAHASLAELYRSENKLALAEDEWAQALQIDRKILGEVHPQIALLLEMLSDVYAARGELGLAREYAERASGIMSGAFGDSSMATAVALTNQASIEQRARDSASAAKDYERAIGIARSHPEYRSLRALMLERYSGLLKTMHRPQEAKALNVEARLFLSK